MNAPRCLARLVLCSRTHISQTSSISRTTQSRGLHSFRTAVNGISSIYRIGTLRLISTGTDDGPKPPDYLSEGELAVFNKLKEKLDPTSLEVQDISGGCGSMYGLDIVSPKFKGLPVIKQHRLVNEILGEDIKKWHGVQLKTRAS